MQVTPRVGNLQGYMFSHLVCSYISNRKTLKSKVKSKIKKYKEWFKYSLLSFLRAAAFLQTSSLLASFWITHTLASTAVYETYNIPIVKKQPIYCFFRNINSVDSCKLFCTPESRITSWRFFFYWCVDYLSWVVSQELSVAFCDSSVDVCDQFPTCLYPSVTRL